ncbi:Opi1-domain-containing protein [Mytilinidion resinicola]|uniref:Opi1-domain-containing protein n=1 Tax=Mytilinidion resinicola TaxID=574789 RepID=A0A6A6Z3C1_9PEZI|nr:Opi1-domain-containing protein [Mytilinidion resinicola]KAF2815631.1 Opi1-domain-containing protein [Mytilinidion resinicola]
MNVQQEHPPAYAHEPDQLQLPSVPQHDLPSSPQSSTRQHLPGIKALHLPPTKVARNYTTNSSHVVVDVSKNASNDPQQWHYTLPLSHTNFPQVPTTVPRAAAEESIGSPMDDVQSMASVEDQHSYKSASIISMDDPDVRLAAEALSGLGNPDFVRSPTNRSIALPLGQDQDPEPLLKLITSSHPWVGGTINGAHTVYTTTKSYTPRFVQNSADFIERNIGSPLTNTVSSVGRRTGVEKNIRRYLSDQRRPSDLEDGNSAEAPGHKRRRVMSGDPMEIVGGFQTPRTRGASQSSHAETLPAYDDHRSPQYEEVALGELDVEKHPQDQDQSQDRRVNWPTQLMITTSGLGAALSDSSLRSLKFCLGLLRTATTHVDQVMHALKLVLEEYERAMRSREQSDGQGDVEYQAAMSSTTQNMSPEREDQVRAIANRMKALSADIWQTIQTVVSSVNRFTGGALPENARAVVSRQVLSLPQRWQAAERRTASSGEQQTGEVRTAHRMLNFAREGLDMMAQVSTVVDGTVVSAETWLDRMGKRRRDEGELEKEGGLEQTRVVDFGREKSTV